jgi:hypothetical protein
MYTIKSYPHKLGDPYAVHLRGHEPGPEEDLRFSIAITKGGMPPHTIEWYETQEVAEERFDELTSPRWYLIEIKYIGPNRESKGRRAHMVRVLDQPARTNLSGEIRLEGWLGTTDDWDEHALGEFTKEEAVTYLSKHFGLDAEKESIKHGEEFFVTPSE